MKLKRILLTTDLSEESFRPFAAVATLAKDIGAGVTLLNFVQDLAATPHGAPLAPPVASLDLGPQMERARKELDDRRASLPEDVDITTEVLSAQDVAKAIVKYATDEKVDLIAISTHGRKGWRRLALGSVAERVLRESPVPVLSFHRPE